MKFMIQRRYLIATTLAVVTPLSILWLNGATAQDNSNRRTSYVDNDFNRFPVTKETPTGSASGIVMQRAADLRSPADHERDAQTRKLLSDYSQSDDEKQRAKILDELAKLVAEQFDARQEVRETELKDLEEKVRKLRELQQRRAKEKDQIVRDRVRQLLRDVDGLGWGDEGRRYDLSPVTVPRPPVTNNR